jgi:general stress protein 26
MIDRRRALKVFFGGIVCMMWPSASRAAKPSPATEAALRASDLIYVATRRKSGERSTVRPIWFYYDGDKLFFTTSPDSWKAKRIARGSPLYIWVGSESGPFLTGTAAPVTDPALVDRMGEAYSKKYWIAWLGFFKPRSDRVTAGKTNAYLVTLSEGEPSAAIAE